MKFPLIACLAIFAFSCQEFTQDNIVVGETKSNEKEKPDPVLNLLDLNQGSFSLKKMVLNIAYNGTKVRLEQLTQAALNLQKETSSYCLKGKRSPTLDKLLKADRPKLLDQWQNMMDIVHQLEVFDFGPFNRQEAYLLKPLYSWPAINYCGLDYQMIKKSRSRVPKLHSNPVFSGLDALEYLISDDRFDTACSARDELLDAWIAQDLKVKFNQRCEYMELITDQLLSKTHAINQAWSIKENNLIGTILLEKDHKKILSHVSTISRGLFVIDRLVKDQKVGLPLGTYEGCEEDSCLDKREHLLTNKGLWALKINIKTILGIYNGFEGFGFNDYLKKSGFAHIDKNVQTLFETILTQLDSLLAKGDWNEALAQGTPHCQNDNIKNGPCQLYQNIRALDSFFKVDFLAVLTEIRAPRNAQGDND